MPSTPSTIRLAFVAALAAFALGACSGGGGKPTTTAGATPAPSPSTPTAGDRTEFFPVRAAQVLHGLEVADPGGLEGKTLDNLLDDDLTSSNAPQFSVFEFGNVVTDNGIPLQTDTKTAAGRYALVAYQAVLEHSVFLFQGGVYSYALDGVTAGRAGGVSISTGVPTTGDPVAGTWTGKAIGIEARNPPNQRTFALTSDQAKARIVKADVEIGISLDGNNQNMTWAFTNWAGGINEYPDVRAESHPVVPVSNLDGNHFLRSHGGLADRSGFTGASISVQFYGPDRKEAGGDFEFDWMNTAYYLQGGFAAKKDEQPPRAYSEGASTCSSHHSPAFTMG